VLVQTITSGIKISFGNKMNCRLCTSKDVTTRAIDSRSTELTKERTIYEGLVVSCINITDITVTEGIKTCKFKSTDDTTYKDGAVFLKNIRLTGRSADKYGQREFLADVVDVEEVPKIIDDNTASGKGKPLFCIHGFNNEPGYAFDGYRPNDIEDESMTGSYNQARKRFAELFQDDKPEAGYYPVPVVWPNSGDYGDDTELANKSAKALKQLIEMIEVTIPDKSLLCHSMGNKILCYAVKDGITCNFENIFMVAADVDDDIFNGNTETGDTWPRRLRGFKFLTKKEKLQVGENIYSMLAEDSHGKPKGKVFVCHSNRDRALIGSSTFAMNYFNRLGRDGVIEDKLVEKFKQYVVNFDCVGKKCEDSKLHSYQFEEWAINFYESKYV